MISLITLVSLVSAQQVMRCFQTVSVPVTTEESPLYPMFYENTRWNRGWIAVGRLPTIKNPAQETAGSLWQGNVEFKVPDLGDATSETLGFAFKNARRDAGDIVSVPIQVVYSCSQADRDRVAQADRDREANLDRVFCNSAAQDVATYVQTGNPVPYVQTIALNPVDRAACNDPNSCACIRLRVSRTRNMVYQQERCNMPFKNNGQDIDMRILLDEEFDRLYVNRCVAAPCGNGGFCSTADMCSGSLYKSSINLSECPTTIGRCCEPQCNVQLSMTVKAPGVCTTAADVADAEEGGFVCLSMADSEPQYSREVSLTRCQGQETHCCVRPACSGNHQRTNVEGVCTMGAACTATGHESTGKGLCPKDSICCDVDGATGNGVEFYAISHITQNNVNQEGAGDIAAFRDAKGTLENSATTATLTVASIVGVVASL